MQKLSIKISKTFVRLFIFASLLLFTQISVGQNKISVHDPVMIRENDTFYLFSTGWGINVWSSTDMKNWTVEKPVFDNAPKWAVEAVDGFKGHIWAPDISFYKGQYYLFYSVSAFGKNTSCIGLATNKTLDTSDPDFKWVDHGKIIQSFPNKTNWNAIDPNLIVDEQGQAFLSFGSFWDGIKLVKLSDDAMSVDDDLTEIPTIASRKEDSRLPNPPAIDNNPVDAGGNAIEAPFIFKKDGYYYLFASIDYCCKGVNSNYKMIVGRSKIITGPYLDKDNKPMNTGGGTILLSGNKDWYGLGHNATVSFDGTDYLVFHAYDASDNGNPKLLIKEITWDKDQWPSVKL
ncbi:arabinan endo-1,5-alpha-L-arabinosidase [Labilibaculum sp. K2S]|uniref:arabinan endo-1,5-alpha-L-arabinosidase n=1 Tax=Labilibaculum sp. K2S TaxID=3056386 RepID=UPI0025A42E36|nr:arabinan endo-1,5-alpha-L-arabinosidase [Labilibaculum sp. K2S]MDM8159553.1 arabinan endo-1,5-alpha-L-arabinosidase [Labilibaculum sp. K2S]